MNFIKTIFQNKSDDETHRVFRRFSKGTFENRAAVEIDLGKSLKVKTSYEFANWFVRILANTIKTKTKITGGIITTKDLRGQINIDLSNYKQFAGVKTYTIDAELSKEELIKIIDSYPEAMFCLSFSTDYGTLKTKVKSPKAPKPGKEDETEVKVDYCIFKTNDLNFVKEFTFDIDTNFKKLKIYHDFVINSLIVPEQYKNDFEKARVFAKRSGKIVRKINLDGKEIVKEIDFQA